MLYATNKINIKEHADYTWAYFFELELFRALCKGFFCLQANASPCPARSQPGNKEDNFCFSLFTKFV